MNQAQLTASSPPSPSTAAPPTSTAATAAAAATAAPAGNPFDTVTVNLDGGTFDRVLPFDRTFLLTGVVDDRVNLIRLRFMETKCQFLVQADPNDANRFKCEVPSKCILPTKDLSTKDLSTKDAGATNGNTNCPPLQPSPPIQWSTDAPASPTGAKIPFHMQVPPLKANHYYYFILERGKVLDADTLKDFQARAAKAIGEVLKDRIRTYAVGLRSGHPDTAPLSIPPAEVETLRKSIYEALTAVAGGQLELRLQQTYLKPSLSNEEQEKYESRFITDLEAIQKPWVAAVDAQVALDTKGSVDILNNLLDQLHLEATVPTHPLAKLLAALDKAVATNPPTAESALAATLLKSHQPERDLLNNLDPRQTERLALAGDSAATTAIELLRQQLRDPDQAGARETAYAGARDRLQALADWLESLESNAALLASAALTKQELGPTDSGLQAVVADAQKAAEVARDLAAKNDEIHRNRTAASASLTEFVGHIGAEARAADVLISSSTIGSFASYQATYMTADFGLLDVPRLSQIVPYIGTNMYLRPINKDTPLREKDGFRRRFAFTIGLTVSSIADSNPMTRKDLFSNFSLVLGAGFRITDSIRLGAGALLFLKESSNPLINETSLTSAPYFSLSFDWDILSSSSFRGIAKLFSS